jgi:hypothetical protein
MTEELLLHGFILLSNFQEVLYAFGFKYFLMLLEVMKAHSDSACDFAECFLFHVETGGIVMITFVLGLHFG